MTPIDFPERTHLIGEHQPEYMPLPAMVLEDGRIISKWELNESDLEAINRDKYIWVSQMAFHQPMQPLLLFTQNDIKETDGEES